MTANAQFKSVIDMAQDTFSDDPELVQEVESEIARRQLIKHLIIHRVRNDMSQQDVAGVMECTQSWVSKLESSDDDDLRLGDLRRYAKATGLEMQLVFSPCQQTIVDKIKIHAMMIRKLLHSLVELGDGDPAITDGIVRFVCIEAPLNLLNTVVDAAKHLPSHMLKKLPGFVIQNPPYSIECEECDTEDEAPTGQTTQPPAQPTAGQGPRRQHDARTLSLKGLFST